MTILAATLWTVTAYAPGCGATGLTKAGTTPVSGHVIAADPAVLPLGSIVHIEGMGRRQVQDTGSAIRGRHLDIFFDDCAEARRWGRQQRAVRILHTPTTSRRR